MNWYKKAQKDEKVSYYEIGHFEGKNILWVYSNGKILTKPVQYCSKKIEEPKDSHIDYWPMKGDIIFRGRFEPHTKHVSIINPFKGTPIPNPILYALYNKFGNDIKITEFS